MRLAPLIAVVPIVVASAPARAADAPAGEGVHLRVTDSSVASQRFAAREGERFVDQGWGAWINRLNADLHWGKWTVGLRLDSSLYWERPIDRALSQDPPLDAGTLTDVLTDNESRFRNRIYAAKTWATYAAPGVEVTAGDAYVQFGRGLTLSMRKIDDLGIDTTVRGAKVQVQKDPFAMTVVGGFANPSRLDESTGRALFPTLYTPPQSLLPGGAQTVPLYGTDLLAGVDVQAGRGLPVTLSTHAVHFARCAPFAYDAQGHIDDRADGFGSPIGSCDSSDVDTWLSSGLLPGPTQNASAVDMAGQSLEVPSLGGHGKLYLEAAAQRRVHDLAAPNDPNPEGNALYGALSFDVGRVSNTFEVKSYRNFYPVAGAISSRASEFAIVSYSAPPTAEVVTQDSAFGFFNACVEGGRWRTDVRASQNFFAYGQIIGAHTTSEVDGGGCDKFGRVVSSLPADQVTTNVGDALVGFELEFDDHLSHLYVSGGAREDRKPSDAPPPNVYYRERHVEYSLAKYVGGPYSFEVTGRYRLRGQEAKNIRSGVEQYWNEGENYVALKVAPKWVFAQGLEYKSIVGEPTYYFNGAVMWKFRPDSNVRLFIGQQRGGLRCVSGICKVFPAFEGARAELTLRF